MSLSPQDAAQALGVVEDAARRSATLRGYTFAAPHLILWGGVYSVAYGFAAFRPELSWLAWAVLVPLAALADVAIARRAKRAAGARRMAGLFATFLAFITATAVIMRPREANQMAAFVPLVVAVAYVVLGLMAGPRLVWTGIALGALTLLGFFAFPAAFMAWMAVVGGGALVLGGVWLNRA